MSLPVRLRKEIEEATKLIDTGRESHVSLSKRFNVDVTDIYDIRRERLATEELRDLEGKIGKRRKELGALDKKFKTLEDNYRERKTVLEGEIKGLQEQKRDVKGSFESQGLSWKEGVRLVSEISNLKAEKAGLQKELPPLRVEAKYARSTLRRLKAQRTDLRGCIKREEEGFNILLGRISSARDGLYAKRREFQVEVARMERYKAGLSSSIKNLEEKNEQLEEQNRQLEEQSSQLEELNSKMKEKNRHLEQREREISTKIRQLEDVKEEIKKTSQEIIEEVELRKNIIIEGAEEKREKMLKEVGELKKEKGILEAEIELVRVELNDVQKLRKNPGESSSPKQFSALEKGAPNGNVEALMKLASIEKSLDRIEERRREMRRKPL